MGEHMFSFLKKFKVRVNFWLDRIIEECDQTMMSAGSFSVNRERSFLNNLFRLIGDFCFLIKAFPRLSVYRFTGNRWTIIFIGNDEYLVEISHLFFENETVQPELIGRVATWNINKKTRDYLKENADLVICETCGLFRHKFSSKIVFTYPNWVNQQIDIPEKLEDFLAGPVLEDKRRQINKANRFSTGWYFTQAEEDFKFFHYKMYLPYISTRHEERAMLSKYEDQYKHWLRKGGLVMITENGEPIAGLICVKIGNVMYAIEAGIILEKLEDAKYSIFTYLIWAGIQWAHHEKTTIFDLGGCRALLSNLSFRSKKRWGGKVVRRPRTFVNYACLAENISQDLREHINELGFITEDRHRFYRIYLTAENMVSLETDSHL